MLNDAELRKACDWENGLISPTLHFDDEVYRQEQERVFGRSWLVVGHEDMVRNKGDFVTNYMGEVPVIVTRAEDGKIRVLVNRCAHRGVEVCLFDRGNARTFSCSYHGWTYDLTGKLVTVPMERQVYGDELNKTQWGLEELVSVATFHGLICASFDPKAPPLADWLGEDVCWWRSFHRPSEIGAHGSPCARRLLSRRSSGPLQWTSVRGRAYFAEGLRLGTLELKPAAAQSRRLSWKVARPRSARGDCA